VYEAFECRFFRVLQQVDEKLLQPLTIRLESFRNVCWDGFEQKHLCRHVDLQSEHFRDVFDNLADIDNLVMKFQLTRL
jgi:hypothetical protein